MKLNIREYTLHLSLILVGAAAGYLYWHFIGCQTGTCPLKSLWYYNVGFGIVLGYLVADMIQDYRKKRQEKLAKE